jgi:hypothetical protein
MKRLVLCSVVFAASVSLVQALEVCTDQDVEFCPHENEVGAEFSPDGSINALGTNRAPRTR